MTTSTDGSSLGHRKRYDDGPVAPDIDLHIPLA